MSARWGVGRPYPTNGRFWQLRLGRLRVELLAYSIRCWPNRIWRAGHASTDNTYLDRPTTRWAGIAVDLGWTLKIFWLVQTTENVSAVDRRRVLAAGRHWPGFYCEHPYFVDGEWRHEN